MGIWCARRDSNSRPTAPEAAALSRLSYGRTAVCLVYIAAAGLSMVCTVVCTIVCTAVRTIVMAETPADAPDPAQQVSTFQKCSSW